MGYYVYLFQPQRFTTAAYCDVFFVENEFPRLDRIVGTADIGDIRVDLPTADQQLATEPDDVHTDIQPLVDPAHGALPPAPAPPPASAADDGPPSRRLRSRSASVVAAAVEGDHTGVFTAAGGIHSLLLDTADGETLHGWWLPALTDEPAKGTIYYLHGNAQNVSAHILNVAWLPEKGYNVFTLDYRGYGQSTGAPDIEGALHDAAKRCMWCVQPPMFSNSLC